MITNPKDKFDRLLNWWLSHEEQIPT